MAQQKYFIIFLIDLINYSICYNKTILETSAFKSNKNCIVLLYGSSASLIAINGVFTLVFVGSILLNSEPYLQSYVGASVSPLIAPGQ